MGERLDALQLLTIRFLLCIATGWFGFSSLRTCLNIKRHYELWSNDYNPTIIPGQTMAAVAGVFLFFWSLSTLSAICFAHGGTLFVLELVDLAGVIVFTIAVGLQSSFLPHTPRMCHNAGSWQTPEGKPSLFALLSTSTISSSTVDKQCRAMVLSWGFSIGVLISYWLSVIHNIRISIKEFGSSDCYWMHDFGGNKRSFGVVVVILCLPLFIIEYGLEMLWNTIPTRTRVWYRYRMRHKRKLKTYRKIHKSLSLESQEDSTTPAFGSPMAFDLEVLNTVKPNRNTRYIVNQSFDTAVKEISRVTFAEKRPYTRLMLPANMIGFNSSLSSPTKATSTYPFLSHLPWHLIVNDLLPYLHYADILHLLLTSRSTYLALLPNSSVTRQTLARNTCPIFAMPPWTTSAGRNYCFGCAIPLCLTCSTKRELSETPITTHLRTCKTACSGCLNTVLATPTSYGDRQWSRACNCHHNRFIYSADADDSIVNADNPSFSRWSWSTQGGKRWRDLCNNCSRLRDCEVKRRREERVRRQRRSAWEMDENGNRGVSFKCDLCLQKVDVAAREDEVPVQWFVCQICSKECRYAMHDQWVVEDRVAEKKKKNNNNEGQKKEDSVVVTTTSRVSALSEKCCG